MCIGGELGQYFVQSHNFIKILKISVGMNLPYLPLGTPMV